MLYLTLHYQCMTSIFIFFLMFPIYLLYVKLASLVSLLLNSASITCIFIFDLLSNPYFSSCAYFFVFFVGLFIQSYNILHHVLISYMYRYQVGISLIWVRLQFLFYFYIFICICIFIFFFCWKSSTEAVS